MQDKGYNVSFLSFAIIDTKYSWSFILHLCSGHFFLKISHKNRKEAEYKSEVADNDNCKII